MSKKPRKRPDFQDIWLVALFAAILLTTTWGLATEFYNIPEYAEQDFIKKCDELHGVDNWYIDDNGYCKKNIPVNITWQT